MLAHREDIDLERELHKVYKMFLHSQTSIIKLKGSCFQFIQPPCDSLVLSSLSDEATTQARSDGRGSNDDALPARLANLCELLVFVKNLELTASAHLTSQVAKLGSREKPFSCSAGEALVIR